MIRRWSLGTAALLLGLTGSALADAPEQVEADPRAEDEASVATRDAIEAMRLIPDVEKGKELYVICAVCHEPEGWGRTDGYYPQIAGQLRSVLIKQLADIRALNRDNPTMYPFTLRQILPTTQDIADVSEYVARLPMARENGVGPGTDLEHGEAIYKQYCADCHGPNGEGDENENGPLLQGQHYEYLVRQFEWIRDGKRRNADPEMVDQIEGFTDRDIKAQMDFISRLRPPSDKVAPPGWRNPDFTTYVAPPAEEPKKKGPRK